MSLLPTRPFDLARPRLDDERAGNTDFRFAQAWQGLLPQAGTAGL